MEEHNGENPQNARIKISYTGKKPKVKFSYPINKKDSVTRGSMFPAIFMIWIVIFMSFYVGYTVISAYDSLDQNYDQTTLAKFVKCVVENVDETIKDYNNVREEICKPSSPLNNYYSLFFMIFMIIIVPSIIYFPFKKFWNKFYPDWQALTVFKKYRKFKSKDIQEYKGNIYIELPVFNNVICDFKATKDFSKYLEEFEIKEYKFQYYKKTKSKVNKKKKRKIRRKNEVIWYARWYFKEKPKEGYLEVIYK